MSEKTPRIEAEHSIELPGEVVDAITDELATRDAPTADDARCLAHDRVDRQTAFLTEDGEDLVAALELE